MGSLSIMHWVIVVGVGVLLFGGRHMLSNTLGDLGKGMRSFKQGMSEIVTSSEPSKDDKHAG